MREQLLLVAEKVVKKEVELIMGQINGLLRQRLDSIWDDPEQVWVEKVIRDSKIKEGLQTAENKETIDENLSIVANHAKSLVYIELKNLQKKLESIHHPS